MCERGGLLIAYDYPKHRALITDADCDAWKCPECSKKLATKWVLRAEIGTREFLSENVPVSFVTITSHEKLRDFKATEAVWRSAWPPLYKAVKRKADIFEYMIIPEKHKDGRMHVHALWTADVTERWLKDNARKRGLGYEAKVKPVTEVSHATRYVTKYIGKSLGEDVPAHFRRVRVSQQWAQVPKPETELTGLQWEHLAFDDDLQIVYEECDYYHLRLIDIRTGENWDGEDSNLVS